ncbi:hypothetical protein SAMN05421736_101804 [Evansella caseinilytica]|uniref:Uncharacterized protein n=1 Tax=Evansella caseinilytica TaxID=1503961 RepID=A0A1H3IG10_9BACI|nr:hypothetical protein [Evansella caseinilytica]SDY26179.1 hypothetical protein SAMN05421736_101804 [Evansella caseinilytica]
MENKCRRSFFVQVGLAVILALSINLFLSSVVFGEAEILEKKYKEHNFSVPVPSDWDAVASDASMIFYPNSEVDLQNKLSIAVINYNEVITMGAVIPQKEMYENTKEKTKWLNELKNYWIALGQPLQRIAEIGDELVFTQEADDSLTVISYVIKNGQPLAVSLMGTGRFSDFNTLKKEGYYDIFQQMVADVAPVSAENSPMIISFLESDEGPITLSSTTRIDNWKDSSFTMYRSIDYKTSGSNITVTRFFNFLKYEHYKSRSASLMRARLQNSTDCSASAIASRAINKTTNNYGEASDSWNPNVRVSSSTRAVTIFGFPEAQYCLNHWRPFN